MSIITSDTRPLSKYQRMGIYLVYLRPHVMERQERAGANSQYVWNWQTRKFERRRDGN